MNCTKRTSTASMVAALAIACWAGEARAQNILVYDNSSYYTHAMNALTAMGFSYTRGMASDFETLLTAGTWDLVVIDLPSTYPSSPTWASSVNAYVAGGGAVIASDWNSSSISTMAPAFEFSYTGDHDRINMYRWDPAHPVFTSPNSVPDMTASTVSDPWGTNGPYMSVTGGGVAIAGATSSVSPTQALIVIGNAGRTIYNGFLFDDYEGVDGDSDTVEDIVELLENEIGLLVDTDADRDADGWSISEGDCNDWNAAVNPGITTDQCDGLDNDCDTSTADGSTESWYGTPCDGDDGDSCEDGILVCSGSGGTSICNDGPDVSPDICDGIDNDCNSLTPDGSGDPRVGASCDGPDADLCGEAIGQCTGGVYSCPDATGDNVELCNGMDDDCNPLTPDGEDEAWLGDACDGPGDADLCEDGFLECSGGAQSCNDGAEVSPDICDGLDNDCNPLTPDGFGDPRVGAACDGEDADSCAEGEGTCTSGTYVCSDGMDDTPELCDGIDNDCDPSTEDGTGEEWFGGACDGNDADLCEEGQYACISGFQVCSDVTGDIPDLCNGVDDDCDPATLDGEDEEWEGETCDGPDTDLCAEGTWTCSGAIQTCNDLSSDNIELCNGADDDCDPSTGDLTDSDGDGASACDGDCNDGDPAIHPGAVETCDGIDQDCDPLTDTDSDGDGYRDCEGDCNDLNSFIHPDAARNCTNGMDNDCNGVVDGLEPECAAVITPPTDDISGCGCSLTPSSAGRAALPMAATAALLALSLAVRRRRPRGAPPGP